LVLNRYENGLILMNGNNITQDGNHILLHNRER
jgi:hypothetical protein